MWVLNGARLGSVSDIGIYMFNSNPCLEVKRFKKNKILAGFYWSYIIIIWIFYNLVRDVCWTPTGWFCDQIHWQELRWLETHVLTSQWVMLHYVHNHLTGFALTCFNLLQISRLSVSPCSQKLCFFHASFKHWVVVTVETSKLLVLKAMDVF